MDWAILARTGEPYVRDAADTQTVFIAPSQADLARLTSVAPSGPAGTASLPHDPQEER